MRNGMSVQEIYQALDQRDRLNEAYGQELQKHLTLRQVVRKVRDRISNNMETYQRISKDRTNSEEDRQDFHNRAEGLREALTIIDLILERENYKLD